MLRKLIFIFATSFLAATLPSAAEHIITSDSCFAHIDSNLYVIGDYMPSYTEEIYVGDISSAGYDVELCYPEFKALSNKELRNIRDLQKNQLLPTDADIDANGVVLMPSPAPVGGLNLKQNMLVNRKKGYLNVTFCPVVRHEGEWKRILSCQVKVKERNTPKTAPRKVQSPEQRWTENSVLNTGKWAQVSVTKEGIYQLTASDIQKMGFSDLSKVKVYGYGGRLQVEKFDFPDFDESVLQTMAPDDLVEVPVYATSDSRLLFWAEGTVRYNWNNDSKFYTHVQNHYSTYSSYFITENDEPRSNVATLSEEISEDNLKTISSTPFVTILDNDEWSWYHGGRNMFDSHDFTTNNTMSVRIATPGININAAGTKRIDVSFGSSNPNGTKQTSVAIKVNSKNLGSMTLKTYNPDYAVACIDSQHFGTLTSLSATESNTFQFTTSNSHKAHFDFLRINYPRDLVLSESPYSYSPQVNGAVCMKVASANATTHLWRIGQAGSPTVEVPSTLADGILEATVSTGKRRFVFFDESLTYEAPKFVKEIANQNLHADSNINYIIIIPENGLVAAEAERLGQLHQQRDGLSYKVVRADELYNEFSSGTPDANAYRRYLKMLYDRAGDDENALPKFCLFMGKSYWDNRLLTTEAKSKQQKDLLLAYEMDDSSNFIGSVYSYVTDDFFALLDDGEGVDIEQEYYDLAMGRMVCSTEEEAKLLVDKVERYLSNKDAGSWKNTVAFLGDDGDSNGHMEDTENVWRAFVASAPQFETPKVYWDRYTWTSSATGYTYPQGTSRIHQLMKEGTLLFNYSGHGSAGMLSHYKLMQISDFAKAYSPYMSVWVLASCDIYPFDMDENTMAETSLYVPDGGSIAWICATRAVFRDRNNIINICFVRNLMTKGTDGKYPTLGEALRLAKNEQKLDNNNKLVHTDGTSNKLKYLCFGDPAIHLSFPTGKVVLDSINGKSISEMSELEVLSAGSVARFAGHVLNEDGTAIDESFDGNVTATVFDCEETITCKNNQKKDVDPMQFKERSKSIYKGTTKAQGGKFEFTVFIPRDISYTNKPGRISLYAVSNDKTHEYNGYSETFCLNGTSDMEEPDTKGPEVIAYINSIDNPDYTITDENPILIADISDEYGINNAGISLGHDIELVLDDNTSDCINLNSYFSYDIGSYQKGQLVYEMKDMTRGAHTAKLRVWDVNNNITTTDVHFIVRSESVEGGKDGYVTATKNPATTDTRFITYFPNDTTVEGMVIYEVYDTRGRCVYKEPVGVPSGATNAALSWDLCGNDHSPLPSGIYFYRTVINTSNGSKATDAQKLIITRQ